MTNTREYPRAGSEKSVPVPAMSSTRITRTRQTQNPRGFGNPNLDCELVEENGQFFRLFYCIHSGSKHMPYQLKRLARNLLFKFSNLNIPPIFSVSKREFA